MEWCPASLQILFPHDFPTEENEPPVVIVLFLKGKWRNNHLLLMTGSSTVSCAIQPMLADFLEQLIVGKA